MATAKALTIRCDRSALGNDYICGSNRSPDAKRILWCAAVYLTLVPPYNNGAATFDRYGVGHTQGTGNHESHAIPYCQVVKGRIEYAPFSST
jgi:hypothetical protein